MGALMSAIKSIDWDAVPLGEFPDREIADSLGVSRAAVAWNRKRLGIPSIRSQHAIDWNDQPLGSVPDPVLAKHLGVSTESVGYQRRARGIKACRPRKDCRAEDPLVQIGSWAPLSMMREIERRAKDEGISRAEWIRRALSWALDRPGEAL